MKEFPCLKSARRQLAETALGRSQEVTFGKDAKPANFLGTKKGMVFMVKRIPAVESWLAYYDEHGTVSNWDELADKRTAALRKRFRYLVKTRFYSNNTFHIEVAFRTKADAMTFAKGLMTNTSNVYAWAIVTKMNGSNVYSNGTKGNYHYQYLTYVADFWNKTA